MNTEYKSGKSVNQGIRKENIRITGNWEKY